VSTAATVTDDTARLRVIDALKAVSGPITIPDVVARTGLAPYEAEHHLNQIVRDYESEIDVDDEGNLVYRFPPGLPGREDIVKKDASRRRKEAFRRGFIAFFKAWTVAMVIIYFIIYVALIIAAIVAMSRNSNSRSSSRSFGSGRGGGSMFFFWGSGSPWGYGGYGSYSSRRQRRRWNRDVEKRIAAGEDPYSLKADPELKKPSLSERTWYYLFGSRGIKRNPLEQEKELLTYIRAKKGFISNADIIALLGVTYEEADRIGTRLVATYDGEMDLTDEGVAIYRFPNLMLTGAPEVQEEKADLGYLWQVRAKELHLRKHPARVVPALNVANIFLAFAVYFWALPILEIQSTAAAILLFGLPLLFSLCFFGVALRRKIRESRDKRTFEQENMRVSVFKLLFTRRTAVRIPGDERNIAQMGLGSWTADQLKAAASGIAEDVRGAVTEEGGSLRIRADRVWAEMGAVEKLRAGTSSSRRVGRTVFSTRADAPIGLPGAGQAVAAGAPAPAATSAAGDSLADEIAALEQELGQK